MTKHLIISMEKWIKILCHVGPCRSGDIFLFLDTAGRILIFVASVPGDHQPVDKWR